MKNIVSFSFVLISILGLKARTIIGPSIDERFLDSLLVVKINEARVKNNSSIVHTSYKLRNYISQKHAGITDKNKTRMNMELYGSKTFNKRWFQPANTKTIVLGKNYSQLSKKRINHIIGVSIKRMGAVILAQSISCVF